MSAEQTLEAHLLVHLQRTAALSPKQALTQPLHAATQRMAATSPIPAFVLEVINVRNR
jgi:hypothetical protein